MAAPPELPAEYVVLLADGIKKTRADLRAVLERGGCTVIEAASFSETRALLHPGVSAVLLDEALLSGEREASLRTLIEKCPGTPIILHAQDRSARRAAEALREGVFWHLARPADPEDLLFLIQRACIQWELRRDNSALRSRLALPSAYPEVVARSELMLRLLRRVDQIAGLDSTVLITGESGTGKSTLARLIHHHSRRSSGPFISLSCAAVPRDLVEAELFGHERGAFTGALQSRAGLVESAEGGTLFLDEIGDMPLELQPKLLGLLQEHKTRRIGSARERHADVRIIAATNRNLPEMCTRGQFREELYFRLNVLPLEAPPLRAHPEDIEALVDFNLRRIAERGGRPPLAIAPQALRHLEGHRWPGNVRELENVLERAAAFCKTGRLDTEDFVELDQVPRAEPAPVLAGLTLHEIEQRALRETLLRCDGDKSAAAKMLGISLKTVYNMLKRAET